MKSLTFKLIVLTLFVFQSFSVLNATNIVKSPPVMTAPGNALAFDGVNDVVNAGNDAKVQLTQGTVEAWIKTPNAGDSWRGIVVKHRAFGLFLCNNELIAYSWVTNSNIPTGVYLNDNKWHHVALSFQSGVTDGTSIYVDGLKKLTFSFSVSYQGVSLGIGNGSTNENIQHFNGMMDEVRIWNVPRTESEINAAMSNELTGTENGLVVYYNFNQGTAAGDNSSISTATDKTSNELNGTLSNFAKTGTMSNFVTSTAFTKDYTDLSQMRYIKFASTLNASTTQISLNEIKAYVDNINIAQSKSITTSTWNNYWNINDNNNSSSSTSKDYITLTNGEGYGPTISNPHFIVVDLGNSYNLQSLKLDINGGGTWSFDYTFDFLVSSNGTNWSLVDHKDRTHGVFTYTNIPIQNVRYIKYSCTYSSDRGQVNVEEIQAYFDGVNIAKNKSVSANSGYGANSAVDDNSSSRWSSNRNDYIPDSNIIRPEIVPVSATVDLGNVMFVDSIELVYRNNTNFSLSVSIDNTNWTKIDERFNNSNSYIYRLNHLAKVSSTTESETKTSFNTSVVVKSEGDAPITDKGVCWSTSPNPTISNDKTSNGSGSLNFTATANNLTEGSMYYIRAYATNQYGVSYGNEEMIIIGLQIETDAVSNITATTATTGGYVSVPNGLTFTKGLVWAEVSNAVSYNAHSILAETESNDFTVTLENLTPGVRYYVRACVAVNNEVFYGKEYNFVYEGTKYVASGGGFCDGEVFTETGTVNEQPYFTGMYGWEMFFDGGAWVIGWTYSYDSGNPPLEGWEDGTILTLQETPVATVTFNKDSLKESSFNDGKINETLTITHDNTGGATFTGTNNENFVETGKAVVRNLPAGLSARIIRKSDLTLTLSITGTASAHAKTNDFSNVKVMLLPTAFTDGNTVTTKGNVAILAIHFIDPVDLSVTGTKSCSEVSMTAESNVILECNSTLNVGAPREMNQLTILPGAKLNLSNTVTVNDVILKADDSNSFSAKLSSCMTVNGTVTFQKTMLDTKWYFLSFPCDVNVADISMIGGGTVGVDFYIQTYSGSNRATHGLGVNWSHITTGTLEAKKGYAFGLKTGIGTKTLSFVLDKTIAECETAATVPAIFYDGSLGNNHKGWNLIGQPYLSKFAGSDVGINYLTTWNGSAYEGQSNSLVENLNPFEAFFVQVAATNSISFSLDGRQAVRSAVNQNLQESIQLNMANDGGTDFSMLIFENELSSDYEIGYDLEKWITTGAEKPQIYSQLNGIKYAYNALPISNVVNLPIGYYSKKGGASTISASNVNVAGLSKLLLIDNQTSTTTDLMNESYSFDADAGTNNSRFSIIPQRISTYVPEKLAGDKPYAFVLNSKLTISNLTANSTIRLYDAIGKLILTTASNGNSTYETALKSAGMYVVQIGSNTGSWSYKLAVN